MLLACGFESLQAHHVVADFVSFATTFYFKKSSLIHSVAPPFQPRFASLDSRLGLGAGREVNASKTFSLMQQKPLASRRFLLHRKPYKDSERGQDSLVRRISPVSLRNWRMAAGTTGHRSRICLTCAADRRQAPLGLRDIAAACGIGKARHVLRVPKEVPARLKPMRPFTFSAPANWRRPWTGPPGGTSRRAASA